ncbi:hypothetical protein ES703_111318 [subsurface metagenome]
MALLNPPQNLLKDGPVVARPVIPPGLEWPQILVEDILADAEAHVAVSQRPWLGAVATAKNQSFS